MTPQEYTESKQYLPDFLKDFHDQKDIFKTISDLYEKDENHKQLPGSWREHHIYVIDFFLWFMGQHGYKLQRDRSKVEFYKLQETLAEFKAKRVQHFAGILKQSEKNTTNEHSTKA